MGGRLQSCWKRHSRAQVFVSLPISRCHHENNIIKDDGHKITFKYEDSNTKKTKTRTMSGAEFIPYSCMYYQADSGDAETRYLHGNCKDILGKIQKVLQAITPQWINHRKKKRPLCPTCQIQLTIMGFVKRSWRPG